MAVASADAERSRRALHARHVHTRARSVIVSVTIFSDATAAKRAGTKYHGMSVI